MAQLLKLKANSNRLIIAFIGGVICQGLYKLYLYRNDREQFEDSNLLVSVALILIAAALIYIILVVISKFAVPKR